MVSQAHRCLFVHVQKTGGMTIAQMMRESIPDARPVSGMGTRHATWRTALKRHPEFDGYWTFGFVRNPWARMVSWYEMVQRRVATAAAGNEYVQGNLARNPFWRGVAEYPDFETFILRGPEEFTRLRTCQLHYLRIGQRRVDFIGRTESLDADMAQVFAHLGVAVQAPEVHNNAGPPRDYRQRYTEDTRAKVAELFAEDIEAFGYEF